MLSQEYLSTMGYIVLVLSVFAIVHFSMSEFRQERASMDWNPKYVSEGYAFTKRTGRGKSYRTNITGTTLHPWSNNVSMDISVLTLLTRNGIHLRYKLCEFFKQKWGIDFLNTYSDISPKCPLPAGPFGFYNVVFPPKNFPIPLPSGDIRLGVVMLLIPTNEVLSNTSIILRH